ncbi:MAG: sigma-54-dependent Fis family transcriptional regulator [Candidatus Solibacter usitatus]|nr:sigma-54-dependent Fis family transcriptional regulator [Candidatus Solibacter usitatus]
MGSRRILIVDDEENIGRSLGWILEHEGFSVTVCKSAAEFDAQKSPVDLYLLDVRLPDANGIDLLRRLRQNGSAAPVIMISGHGTIADAVEAVRIGAYDFLEKPLSRERVLLAVRHALDQNKLERENEALREIAGGEPRMIGASAAFRQAVEQATMAARSDARILLKGESGTGKELLAAHVHQQSPFAAGPFVKVNCAAIPTELIESELFGHEKGSFTGATSARRGKFELADGGTIFLDEVGDLHAASQAKLLRVLQEGEFHRVGGEKAIRVAVRVIAATNRNLEEMVSKEKFREDLYYRLCVVPIRLPALRERPDDIPALASYFLEEFCRRNNFRTKCFEVETVSALSGYAWPGNARELRNAVERMAILSAGERIGPTAVPLEIRNARPNSTRNTVQEAREGAERDHILRALEHASWNVSSAARALGMERTNLHKRMRTLGLHR